MKDCVFDINGDCIALTDKQCVNCSFCKTKEDLILGRKKFFARLDIIPPAKRIRILETYYGVHKLWLK